MNDSVVAIVSAFFIIGIMAGIVAVVALSVLRAGRPGHQGRQGHRLEYGPRGPGEQQPEPKNTGWDEARPDDHPRWPGDADNDFSGE